MQGVKKGTGSQIPDPESGSATLGAMSLKHEYKVGKNNNEGQKFKQI
jgi:hypothetical protein